MKYILLMTLTIIAAAESVAQTSESDSLEDLVSRYEQTWRSHDAKRLGDFFTADADMIAGIQPRVVGRAAIETWWGVYFAHIDSDRALSITIDSMRKLGPDVALLNVDTTTHGTDSEASQALEARKARGTWVVTRIDGDWKIAAIRMHSPVGSQRQAPGTDH